MRNKFLLMLTLMLISISSYGQSVSIKGVVQDNMGEPLMGVTVIVEGTNYGVVTDIDGKFEIKAKKEDKLSFQYVGFKKKTVNVGDKSSFTIVMQQDTKDLDEVVVVGYGTQRKSDISTAISTVNIDDILKSGSSEALQALQGKISGVQITSSDGSLSSGLNFRIRGVNSITGGTQPLFVIDGVPMPTQNLSANGNDPANNPLLGFNPNDIESMEVLKDAAAASIYGANGSNGVIIINTKKGKALSKPKFSFNYTRGLDEMASNKLEVLSPENFANKILTHASFDNTNTINFWNQVIETQGWNDPSVHVWMDEVTQTAHKNDLNASLTGGSDKTNYMISAGYLNNTGIIKRSSLSRFTSRLNLKQKLNSKMNLEANVSYSNTLDNNPITDWSQSGVILNALRTSPYLQYPGYSQLMNYSDVDVRNPIKAIEDVTIKNSYKELNGRMAYNYDIIKGLNFFTSISYRNKITDQRRFWGPSTWFGQSERGRMELGVNNESNWVFESRLQYSKSIKKHYFSIMGAFESSKWNVDQQYNKATGFEDTSTGIWGISQGLVTYAPSLTYDANQSISYIARASYTYNNKYVMNASVRMDGSSKFGDNNKYGTFPSLSLAWRASEEEFIKKMDAISNLRLRASFGMTGNKQIPSYQSLSLMSTNKVVFDENSIEIGRYPNRIANKDLKWESQKQYNIGLDLGVFRNRYTLTADFYYKIINDMLLEVAIPSTSGYTKAWQNSGSMQNKGIDLNLSAHWIQGAFNWTTDFNFSLYRNKINTLAPGQYQQFYSRNLNEKVTNDVLLRVGMPVGIYYGYISDGVYNNDIEVANGYPGPNLAVGELKVVDVNHDGIIDTNDRVPVANVNPKHTGGIGNTFTYKGFDLYAFFRWSYGNDVINANAFYLSSTASQYNVLTSVYKDVWSTMHPENNYPLYGTGKWGSTVMRSDIVEDGSFLRLQTLTLGYTFPNRIVNKLGLSKLRLSATGSNLLLLTKYSGFDPEANTGYGTVARIAQGFDMSPYPRPRSISFAIQLGL